MTLSLLFADSSTYRLIHDGLGSLVRDRDRLSVGRVRVQCRKRCSRHLLSTQKVRFGAERSIVRCRAAGAIRGSDADNITEASEF